MTTPIIGIGTARSGTKSLAYLFREQGLDVTHEGTTSVAWDRSTPTRYRRMKQHLEEHDGDVACWLTQAAADLLEETEGKVVALKRPREDTVESLCEHMAEVRIREDKAFGPMVFPTYPDVPLPEAWQNYWELYRETLGGLVSAYPERVLCVETYDLESEETQAEIAGHFGIEDWTHVKDAHLNEREGQGDGMIEYDEKGNPVKFYAEDTTVVN